MKRFSRIVLLLCTTGILILACLIFIPRHYQVPVWPAKTHKTFWQLNTGSTIAYTLLPAQGNKQLYPVIYLHGGPGGFITGYILKRLQFLAAAGYDVYCYDQVGSGQSERLTDIRAYTTERHKRDLEAIVQMTGAHQVILLGQSWGAILGLLYTADNQDKVARIIFTGPGPIPPMRRELASIPAPDSLHLKAPVFSNRQGNKEAANIRTQAMQFFACSFGWKLAKDAEADQFETYLNGLLNRSTVCDTAHVPPVLPGSGYYVQEMTLNSFAKTPDPRTKLKGNTIPALIIKGQCDNQHWGFTQEYLQLFPDNRLAVISNAGHAISWEQPELYEQTILQFLAQADSLHN